MATHLPSFEDVLVIKIQLSPERPTDGLLHAWVVVCVGCHQISEREEATAVERACEVARKKRVDCYLSDDAGIRLVECFRR